MEKGGDIGLFKIRAGKNGEMEGKDRWHQLLREKKEGRGRIRLKEKGDVNLLPISGGAR